METLGIFESMYDKMLIIKTFLPQQQSHPYRTRATNLENSEFDGSRDEPRSCIASIAQTHLNKS
jgi:hypothetical protein